MLDPLKTPAAPTAGLAALTKPANAPAPAAPKPNGLAQGQAWRSAVPAQINDSVADKVQALTAQDSPLMQQAKTAGLKTANRRGLLNSSMAVGASQDAMVRTALPIAAQDAAQAAQKNMQARDFEFRMEGQDDQQGWQSGENVLDRTQQTDMQKRQITSTEGLAAAQRDLDLKMQAIGIAADERMQIRDISSREGMAAAERALQERMQGRSIASQEGMQGRDIAFRGGQAALDRSLQAGMQITDLNARADLADNERRAQFGMQANEIAYQSGQRQLDRNLQQELASWNLKSADRNAAAQFISNMNGFFEDSYASIMANPSLDAATREAQIVSARNLRDRNMGLVRQMYNVSISW